MLRVVYIHGKKGKSKNIFHGNTSNYFLQNFAVVICGGDDGDGNDVQLSPRTKPLLDMFYRPLELGGTSFKPAESLVTMVL
jgi:hypothetical protein